MQNRKVNMGLVVFTIFVSLAVILLSFSTFKPNEPMTVYTVYLDGKSIGSIASKDTFNEYVNSKEEELKKKYDVDTV